jgi:hypothetical protein
MSKKLNILFLFILLVITLISGFYFGDFTPESFISSSEKNKGQGIGNSFAPPLDLAINTNNSNFFDIPTTF